MKQTGKTEAVKQAQHLIDQGRWSSAISIYQKIVETDPSDLSSISVLGDLYVKAGRTQEAVEHFLRIAENYVRRGSAIGAAHILKKVLKIDPASARAHMNLGELSLRGGKPEQAHDYFIEAGAAFWHKENVAAAIKMNERALACQPNSRQAKSALSLLQQEVEERELPAAPKPITGELAPILISIPDEADHLTEPELPVVKHVTAELASESMGLAGPKQVKESTEFKESKEFKEFMEALEEPEPLPSLDDDELVTRIASAELLVAQGQSEQAIASLRDALQYRPDHVQIREKIKDIYLRSEMTERACEECLNIAGIYSARNEMGRAHDYITRARLLRDSSGQTAIAGDAHKGKDDQEKDSDQRSLGWNAELRHPAAVM